MRPARGRLRLEPQNLGPGGRERFTRHRSIVLFEHCQIGPSASQGDFEDAVSLPTGRATKLIVLRATGWFG
jgi:hypothetical protein